jgi:6-phosphogluconolactonase
VRPTLRILPDHEAMSRRAAGEFARRAAAAVRRRGVFRVALAGGGTPARLYALLADPRHPWRRRIPWQRVHVFFGDERLVPADHPERNSRMARRTLLDRVPIPAAQIHEVPGPRAAAGTAAARAARGYARRIRRVFGLKESRLPRFDLILLGLGEDGHTASLFPRDRALAARGRLVAAARPAGKTPRVTLTLPVLNAARALIVLASGASKGAALRAVLRPAPGRRGGGPPPEPLPAARLRPARGHLLWLVDRAAARHPVRRRGGVRPARRVC